MMPSKAEIVARAKELYYREAYKTGLDLNIPEIAELEEEGFLNMAKKELMSMKYTKQELEQYKAYLEVEKPKESLPKIANRVQCSNLIPFDFAEAEDTGFFCCGTSQSGKTTLAKYLAQALMRSNVTVYVLDVSRAWAQETPIANVVTVPHNGNSLNFRPFQSTVFDLSQLSFGERMRFVNSFTNAVYDAHKSFGYKKAPFAFILYEESQTYVANGCLRSYKKYAPLIDLITVGANFNLRFGLITQFPAMVDKAPVKIAQQRYFGWTTEKNDLDYIRKFIGKSWVEEIKQLRKGEFLYQCRNEITKFSVKPYGSMVNKSNNYSYSYNFPLSMMVV
jgi:hypothetical protein